MLSASYQPMPEWCPGACWHGVIKPDLLTTIFALKYRRENLYFVERDSYYFTLRYLLTSAALHHRSNYYCVSSPICIQHTFCSVSPYSPKAINGTETWRNPKRWISYGLVLFPSKAQPRIFQRLPFPLISSVERLNVRALSGFLTYHCASPFQSVHSDAHKTAGAQTECVHRS